MAQELGDFEKSILEGAELSEASTEAGGFISPEGDCAFFYLEDVEHYAERVDDLLTLYLALDNERIVGAEIKGISRLPKHDLMALVVGHEVPLVGLLLATFAQSVQKPPRERYYIPTEQRLKRYTDAVTTLHGGVNAGPLQTA